MATSVNEGCEHCAALTAAILDIDAHATAMGEDKDGFVADGYIITVGSLHRALGLIGHTAPRKREHAVWIETEHGSACDGCQRVRDVALDALKHRPAPALFTVPKED